MVTCRGIRILDERQVEMLRGELAGLLDPHHPGHELFYEYHSNESIDPSKVLFHALGAWRVTPGFHDLLWAPAFTMAASQLWEAQCGSGTTNCSASRLSMAAWWRGIRIIPTGPARSRWRI